MGVSEEKLFGKDGRAKRHFGKLFFSRNNLKKIRHFETEIESFIGPLPKKIQ